MKFGLPERVKSLPEISANRIKQTDKKLSAWIDSWNPYIPEKIKDKGLKPVEIEESDIRRQSTKIFLIFFSFFLLWAFFAPIDSGVTVPGNVTVLGNRKLVQHPTGGVVEEILVKDGSEVQKGDVLLRVNPRRSAADLSEVELSYINLLSVESRLKSERDGLASIKWTEELEKNFPNDPRVEEAKRLQQKLLESRRAEYNSQVSGLNEQIAGLGHMLDSYKIQIKSLDEEMRSTKSLANDGFVPRTQANQAERVKSDLDSRIASTQADIARARLQITQARGSMLKEIDTQLQDIQKSREPLLAKLDATKFDRSLTEVRAPVSGSVVGLKVFTVGGVITGAQTLMEIVPKDEALIVQAKVPPTIIDKVKVGMDVDMHFTAFNQSTTPVVPGTVKVVGADKEKSADGGGDEYYLAEIETTKEGIKMLGGLQIQPGMPADIIVKSGQRSFMAYLLKPMTEKLSKAFLEN